MSVKRLTAIFEIKDGRIHLERKTEEFPYEDFQNCINLLARDLQQELAKKENKTCVGPSLSQPLPEKNQQ